MGRLSRRLGALLTIVAAAIAGLLFTVLLVQIVARAAGQGFVWVEEFSTVAFIWLVFAGAGAAFVRNEHLQVDLLQGVAQRLGPRSRAAWQAGLVAAQTLFLVVFAAGLVLMTRQAWSMFAGSISGFRYGWLYAGVFLLVAVALAGLLLGARASTPEREDP